MMHVYIPAARHDLAVQIAVSTLGPPRFSGKMMTWEDAALLICPESVNAYTYVRAYETSPRAVLAYRAISGACTLLADQVVDQAT